MALMRVLRVCSIHRLVAAVWIEHARLIFRWYSAFVALIISA